MEKENNAWQWGEDKEDTLEERAGKIEMLKYLILDSHFLGGGNLECDHIGWSEEELKEELSKLIGEENRR